MRNDLVDTARVNVREALAARYYRLLEDAYERRLPPVGEHKRDVSRNVKLDDSITEDSTLASVLHS
jgi:hypothetical protein